MISGTKFISEKNYKITKDYDIIGKVGSGAFSQTFKGRHKITKQVRCIKKLKKKDFKKEEQEKLIEEVLILKDLDHPNIGI
jgi:calcium-dependent protein kinase